MGFGGGGGGGGRQNMQVPPQPITAFISLSYFRSFMQRVIAMGTFDSPHDVYV